MSTPPANWSLVTCRLGVDGPDVAAIRLAGGRLVQPDALRRYTGLIHALEDWRQLAPLLQGVDPDGLPSLPDAWTVASLRYPRKLLCVGANYRDHLAEMGSGPDPAAFEPFFFTVPATTTIIGDGESIVIPSDPALSVDWEAELAVVIGTEARDIPLDRAYDHVAGYACFNDVTARGLLRRTDAFAEPFRWDWAGSKGLDTFCPIGAVTPSWMVDNPNDLGIRCVVNGATKQDSTTANFIRDVAEVVSAASRTWTLQPGDVIATGTPAGVGHARGERLVAGDVVRVEIDGLTSLTNVVTARVAATTPILAV